MPRAGSQEWNLVLQSIPRLCKVSLYFSANCSFDHYLPWVMSSSCVPVCCACYEFFPHSRWLHNTIEQIFFFGFVEANTYEWESSADVVTNQLLSILYTSVSIAAFRPEFGRCRLQWGSPGNIFLHDKAKLKAPVLFKEYKLHVSFLGASFSCN